MNRDTIRVIVVDDHPGVRAGIRGLLTRANGIDVVAEAKDGASALAVTNDTAHDVVVLDVELPKMRGDQVARKILDRHPTSKILAVSSYDDQQYIRSMLANGAAGYITKDEVPNLLLDAIRGVAAGEHGWVSRRVVRQTGPLEQDVATFTLREREILKKLATARSYAEIADDLSLSEGRLMSFVSVLEGKLGVKGRPALSEAAQSILGTSQN
ncbi:MAG: response regulator transcription factor [Anaerolineales bacterium]